MNTIELELPAAPPPSAIDSLPNALNRVLSPPAQIRMVGTLVLLNLLLLFVRPQYSIPLLGKTYMVAVMGLFPLPFLLMWYRGAVTTQTKAMVALVVYGALMAPFVRNNFWAFHTWRDITQSILCFLFPIVVFLSYGQPLRRLLHVVVIIGFYLGIYTLLHAGKGPGAFLGDENDAGFALVMTLAFPLFMFQHSGSPPAKACYLAASLVILGGIVATTSRGTFVGCMALSLFYFWKSQQKGAVLALFLICLAGSLFVVPEAYWADISTIQQTDQGTALARRVMWKRAFRIFIDPRHTVTGVGMENTRYYINEYENAADYAEINRSFAGRQVHSMYLQLLADLGIIGIAIFAGCVVPTFRGNRAIQRRVKAELARLPQLADELQQRAAQTSSVAEDGTVEQERASLERLPYILHREFRLLQTLCTAVSASLTASLVSAAFISVLYYPVIWFLFALAAAVQVYAHRLFSLLDETFTESTSESREAWKAEAPALSSA